MFLRFADLDPSEVETSWPAELQGRLLGREQAKQL
jgi:hypothetical protein